MKLILRREKPQPSHTCTLGLLLIPEASLTLCTMELPWIPSATCKGGLKGKSCVPVGTYKLVKHNSPKHPKTWALVNHDLDVVHYEGDDHDPDEDRATCLLHVANFARQLQGCCAPGLAHTIVNDEYMVTSSAKAMEKIRSVVPWTDEHTLSIEEGT
jgi:hypothetical protein